MLRRRDAVYVLATWLTDAAFMGDTEDYVDSAVAFRNGVDYRFWEFGHLFWRPLGWLLSALRASHANFRRRGRARGVDARVPRRQLLTGLLPRSCLGHAHARLSA